MKLNHKRFLRWHWMAGTVLLFLIAVFLGIRHAAKVPEELVHEAILPGQPSKTNSLVVIVHGYTGSAKTMEKVVEATRKVRPEAHIACLEYPAGIFSNANCFEISRQIRDKVQALDKPEYKKIELVGYSMGALLLRKAYVYGWGMTEDCPRKVNPGGASDAEEFPQSWVKKVDRIVLLAGMNRGWTTRPQPKGANFQELWTRFLAGFGKFAGWATDTAHLIRQCERGEPFVANLRMQWLKVMSNKNPLWKKPPAEAAASTETPEAVLAGAEKIDRPTVIQLLGDIDNRVSEDDSRDVSVAKDFVWVQLEATDHDNAKELESKDVTVQSETNKMSSGQKRAWKFMKAFSDDEEIKGLRLMSPAQPGVADPNIVEAVIVLHGIRDRGGEWTAGFEQELQSHFRANHGAEQKLLIYRPTYGYFAMGPFLLGIERQKNVRWFMDEMTELKAKYPNLETIHFIGHSNGTYVLAEALKKYRTLKMDRIVLAGSVLPRDFNWTNPALRDRFDKVRNFAGRSDLVVGWFPGLFEFPLFHCLNRDLGSAGYNGFARPATVAEEDWKKKVEPNQYRPGGHGEIIKEGHDSIIQFLTVKDEGVGKTEEQLETEKEPKTLYERAIRLLSDAAYLVWLVILTALILLGKYWCKFTTPAFAGLFHARWAPAAALAAYGGLIVILLQFL